jgi:hypothetical protein
MTLSQIRGRRQALWFIIALMFLFSGVFHFAATRSAGAEAPQALQANYLPIIRTQSTFSQTIVHGGDHGDIASAMVDGHRIVAYQLRPSGIMHITEDTGGPELVELPLATAALAGLDIAPSFTIPNSPKQGAIIMEQVNDALWIWVTARKAGDTTGPFVIQRLVIPTSMLWPPGPPAGAAEGATDPSP